MRRVVLASKSAARRQVLTGAGVDFDVVVVDVDESVLKTEITRRGGGPREVALALSQEKARVVSARTPGLVIGADQTLDLFGRLIDKAETVAEARARLLEMRGMEHLLHSGVALAENGEIVWSRTETAVMVVRPFSDAWLDAYLADVGEQVLSSVGCYQLEGLGVQLFERIEGDFFTILGLPLLPLLEELRRRGALVA